MELESGRKLAIRSKHQGGKWSVLNDWGKTVKVTKPQGAKRKLIHIKITPYLTRAENNY
ncbi:hypothetical protein Hanom_Chr06g00525901 [Helianthus anomalus]